MVNGASNCSVPSVSTTVIVPLFCEKLAPAMVDVPAGVSGLGKMPSIKPLSMSMRRIRPQNPGIRHVERRILKHINRTVEDIGKLNIDVERLIASDNDATVFACTIEIDSRISVGGY